ncbi:inactive tyrosine-protein kinase PRAG1 isoform X1 [Polypterus senegalus]
MDSSSGQRDARLPPALPAKLRRQRYSAASMSSSGSSIGTEMEGSSPAFSPGPEAIFTATDQQAEGSKQATSDATYVNVGFRRHTPPSSSRCHWANHKALSHDSPQGEAQKPPPLPRKLTRAHSVPGGSLFPTQFMHTSPSPGQLGPIYCPSESEPPPVFTAPRSPLYCSSFPQSPTMGVPRAAMSELNFDTPDQDLKKYFTDLHNRELVHQELMERNRLSLRDIAAHLEAQLQEEILQQDDHEVPMDLQLAKEEALCESGDALYYAACSATSVEKLFTIKVYKVPPGPDVELNIQKELPPHFNVQKLHAHFHFGLPVTDNNNVALDNDEGQLPRSPISVVGEAPAETLQDFVRRSSSLHATQPLIYERLICLLLLQLCEGLQHLKSHKVTHCALRLENLLLLPTTQDHELPRLLISNFSRAKQKCVGQNQDGYCNQDRLAPELISVSQYKKADEFQLGILIYECLHQSNPFASSIELSDGEYRPQDLPSIPQNTIYSSGLQKLSHLLLEPEPATRMPVSEAKCVLQALLWGPREDLFHENQMTPFLTSNWIEVKRCVLMLRQAETAIERKALRADLEHWLMVRYFTTATPQTIFHAAHQLQLFRLQDP